MKSSREYAEIDFSNLTDGEKYTLMTALCASQSERAWELYQRLTREAAPAVGQIRLPMTLPVADYPARSSAAGSHGWAR